MKSAIALFAVVVLGFLAFCVTTAVVEFIAVMPVQVQTSAGAWRQVTTVEALETAWHEVRAGVLPGLIAAGFTGVLAAIPLPIVHTRLRLLFLAVLPILLPLLALLMPTLLHASIGYVEPIYIYPAMATPAGFIALAALAAHVERNCPAVSRR